MSVYEQLRKRLSGRVLESPDLQRVWGQQHTPVLYRPKTGDLVLRTPYRSDNCEWITQQAGPRARLEWDRDRQRWTLARNNFTRLTAHLAERYGQVYTVTIYHPKEECAPACWVASGSECTCKCLGLKHGSDTPPEGRLTVISEAYAFGVGKDHFAVRLVTSSASVLLAQVAASSVSRAVLD